jgi:hypothetical protein
LNNASFTPATLYRARARRMESQRLGALQQAPCPAIRLLPPA